MKVDTMMRVMRPNKIMVVKFQLKTNFDPYIDWVSSTVGGKNGKTSVLPGFSKIKRSSAQRCEMTIYFPVGVWQAPVENSRVYRKQKM